MYWTHLYAIASSLTHRDQCLRLLLEQIDQGADAALDVVEVEVHPRVPRLAQQPVRHPRVNSPATDHPEPALEPGQGDVENVRAVARDPFGDGGEPAHGGERGVEHTLRSLQRTLGQSELGVQAADPRIEFDRSHRHRTSRALQ